MWKGHVAKAQNQPCVNNAEGRTTSSIQVQIESCVVGHLNTGYAVSMMFVAVFTGSEDGGQPRW